MHGWHAFKCLENWNIDILAAFHVLIIALLSANEITSSTQYGIVPFGLHQVTLYLGHPYMSSTLILQETMHNVVPEEDKAQGRISLLTYLKYYKEGGGILLSSLLILVYFMTEVGTHLC